MSVEMRGTAFVTFFQAIRELRGPSTEAAVRAALPTDLKDRLERGAVARIGWYPLTDYTALHDTADRVIGGGVAFARQLGRASTEIDTRGLIRYVLAIASPELLVRHAPLVFSSYVRGASVRVDQRGPGHVHLFWENLRGTTPLLNAELTGGAAFLVERVGGRDVEVVALSPEAEDTHALDVRWR